MKPFIAIFISLALTGCADDNADVFGCGRGDVTVAAGGLLTDFKADGNGIVCRTPASGADYRPELNRIIDILEKPT